MKIIMKQYINKRLVSEFRKRIPKIIGDKIGQKPINPDEDHFGVAKDTFRAYRGYNEKPSYIYRLWAQKITTHIVKKQSKINISTCKSFSEWHKKLYKSLQEHWKKHQGKYLPLSHCYKLLDLYLKWISTHQFQKKAFLRGIVKNANCALDKHILEQLNECYSMALPISNPSMGNIHNHNTYDLCQELITEFSKSCNGTRLLFDFWAWK